VRATATLGQLIAEHGGSIKTGPFGTTLKANEYSQAGVPIISVGEVAYGSLSLRRDTPCAPAEVTKRLPEYLLEKGDIVFGRKGAVDRSAWVKESEDGWFLGSDGIRVRLPSSVDSRFVAYQFQSEATRTWLLQHASGSTMLSLNQKVLERVPLQLPDFAQQRAIADVLGALDDKITVNAKLGATAQELAAAEFHRLSRHLPFSDQTFGDVAKVGGGGTPSTANPEFWNGDVLWATPTDVTALQGPYLSATSRRISEAGLSACASEIYPAGAILMTSRATIGAFALAQAPMAVNQGFIVVQPHDRDLRFWLFHEMRSRVDEFISLANGATFLELSRGNFKKFKVRVAEAPVMNEFTAFAEPIHAAAANALSENTRLSATRDALLPELMSGNLRVKDAEKVLEEVGA